MIEIRCLEDCNADIVMQSENETIECFNCHRQWGYNEFGEIVVIRDAIFAIYQPLPGTREEILP